MRPVVLSPLTPFPPQSAARPLKLFAGAAVLPLGFHRNRRPPVSPHPLFGLPLLYLAPAHLVIFFLTVSAQGFDDANPLDLADSRTIFSRFQTPLREGKGDFAMTIIPTELLQTSSTLHRHKKPPEDRHRPPPARSTARPPSLATPWETLGEDPSWI
jgi:hypothetical protein